jgi:hypothetical protein
MRLFLLPTIVASLFAADQPVEPSEHAMRAAFEIRLTEDVQNAMAYVAETSGPEGVERVRAAGTDQFEIRTFKKQDCVRNESGYVCDFAVELSVVNGMIQQTLKGRFLPGPSGQLTFIHAI